MHARGNLQSEMRTIVLNFYRALPELLFYMIELQNLMLKHAGVIARYHIQYVEKCDALALAEMLPALTGLSERELFLVKTAIEDLQNVASKLLLF